MRHVAILLGLLCSLSFPTTSWALHPSRTRLLLHSAKEITPEVSLSAHFVPAGNFIGDARPLVYFGADFKVAPWLTLSPVVGWAFGPDNYLVGAWIYALQEPFWGFIHLEYHPDTTFSYAVTMAEVRVVAPWLSVGLEQETWLYADTDHTVNVGGGPNILFRFGMARFDVAFHLRDKPDEKTDKGNDEMIDGEIMVRFHAYF